MERHIISNRGLSWSYLIQREHLSRHERIKSLVREARDTNTVVGPYWIFLLIPNVFGITDTSHLVFFVSNQI